MLGFEAAFYFAAIFSYASAFAWMALAVAVDRPFQLRRARWLVALGVLLQALALGLRAAGGVPPFLSYYESISFACWAGALGYLWVARRGAEWIPTWIGAGPAVVLLMGSAALSAGPLEPLSPALQSWWLAVHVTFALLAVAALSLAFGLAVLVIKPFKKKWLPSPEKADLFFFRCLSLAFLFQATMILAGAIWANKAWGRFWGWDPIETTSLLTLAVYAVAIHLRSTYGWRGKKLALITLIAFVLTVYGVWGVPMLMPSMHLYQAP